MYSEIMTTLACVTKTTSGLFNPTIQTLSRNGDVLYEEVMEFDYTEKTDAYTHAVNVMIGYP